MGLFNFIYKLTIIFSNKKKLKIFVAIALVIILVFAWTRGSFAVETLEPTDLGTYQLYLQQTFVSRLRYLYQNKPSGYSQDNFNNIVNLMRSQYFYVNIPSSVNALEYEIFFYAAHNSYYENDPNIFNVEGTWSVGVNSGVQYTCMLGLITPMSVGGLVTPGGDRTTPTFSTNVSSVYMPSDFYMIRSTYVDEFLNELGLFTNLETTYSSHDAELQAVTSAGFNSVNNSINNQTNQMTNSINSASSSITNSVNSLNNTITDDSVSVTSSQLPSEDITDPTTDGLDNLFIMIKDAFTGTPQSVSFPVPFTNQSFTIEPGFTETSMRKGGLATMVTIIHLYWYYRIYSYIFLRYVDLLEKLKEGDFEETVGNIKKEVL